MHGFTCSRTTKCYVLCREFFLRFRGFELLSSSSSIGSPSALSSHISPSFLSSPSLLSSPSSRFIFLFFGNVLLLLQQHAFASLIN